MNKREHLEEFKQTSHFIMGHLEQFSSKGDEISDDLFVVTDFLLKEIADLYTSMDILYTEGQFRSCLSLGRSVAESLISLKYIYDKETELRASNYRHYSTKEYLSRSEKFDIPEDKKPMMDYLKNKASEYKPSGTRPYAWDGKNVREMADEVGWSFVYEDYGHLSTYLHSKFRGNRDLENDRPYNNHLKRIVFRNLLIATLDLLKVITEKFDLDGGVMSIDGYSDKIGVLVYATNPKKSSEDMAKVNMKLVRFLTFVPFMSFFFKVYFWITERPKSL